MKIITVCLLLIAPAFAFSDSLGEIDDTSSYNMTAFRAYCEKKQVPKLPDESIRVFYMDQGLVTGSIQISLETGEMIRWSGWSAESEPVQSQISQSSLDALNKALVKKKLESVPKYLSVLSSGGTAHLLELRDQNGYYFRQHRNSTSEYFLKLTALLKTLNASGMK